MAAATIHIADLASELDAGMTSIAFTAHFSVDSSGGSAPMYAGAVLTEEQSDKVVGISNVALSGTQGAVNVSISIPKGLSPIDETTTCVSDLPQAYT